ncbi:MAG: TetR/AcrR family transcriptional regulator [Acidobacteriota bacterium]|nr:TetR/AcrR family transcriptional regulator [Acidobacteriota bacterium]
MTSISRAQKKRTDILNAACELFLKQGYDAVSLDDILEKVGGSKATLYSYYGGKEGLFAATVKKMCHDKLGPLLEMDVAHLDPSAGLNAIGRQFLSIVSNPEGRAIFRTVISESQRFPDLASTFFASGPQTTTKILQRNIEHWQKQGALKRGNPEALAAQFLGLILGNFHLKHLLGLMEPMTPKQIRVWVASATETFLEGALAR